MGFKKGSILVLPIFPLNFVVFPMVLISCQVIFVAVVYTITVRYR